MRFDRLAHRPRQRNPAQPIVLDNFRLGLNTAISSSKIQDSELSSCINFTIDPAGGYKTRPGLTVYTNTAFTYPPHSMEFCPVGATNYEVAVTQTDFKAYYLDGSKDPALIGTLEANAEIVPYNGVAIFLDGSFIKYWDGTTLALCYDDGTGARGFQFDNSDGSDDGSIALGNGTTTRVAYKFTSQAFTAGWTIPPTTITAKLAKTGSPTGDVSIVIRLVSDSSVLATKTLIASASLTGTATEYSVAFVSGDITTELSGSIPYYFSLEYAAGDGANYVNVHYTTTASGGHSSSYAPSTWTDDATKDPICSLKPGVPPKGAFGAVKEGRLYVGGDPDNPGYVWYSNLTYLDWSTADGGGYVGAVDDNKNNFAVGAIIAQYGDLYVFGKKEQPYLAKLTGSTPSEYSLPPLFQRIYALPRTLKGVISDIWYCDQSGVNALSGIQEYGDLRAYAESDSVKDKMEDYYDASAFSGYNSNDGQYFIKLTNYQNILVFHTKSPSIDPASRRIRYPVTEYQLARERLTDTSLYKWTASGSGTNEYYVELLAGGDPSLEEPHYLLIDDEKCTTAALGSLTDHTWNYGDNDTLGYSTVYVRDNTGDPDTSGVEITTILEPTSFGAWQDKFFIAGDNGHVYYLDSSVLKDNTVTPRNGFQLKYYTLPFGRMCLERYNVSAQGGSAEMDIYTDGDTLTPSISTSTEGGMGEAAIDDLTMLVSEADFLLSEGLTTRGWLNIDCESFMVAFRDVSLGGEAYIFRDIAIEARKAGR